MPRTETEWWIVAALIVFWTAVLIIGYLRAARLEREEKEVKDMRRWYDRH